MADLFQEQRFDMVVNLAAQAGVRNSLENPHAYADANLNGFLNVLEGCRHTNPEHLIFASSSSVYGMNTKTLLLSRIIPNIRSVFTQRLKSLMS